MIFSPVPVACSMPNFAASSSSPSPARASGENLSHNRASNGASCNASPILVTSLVASATLRNFCASPIPRPGIKFNGSNNMDDANAPNIFSFSKSFWLVMPICFKRSHVAPKSSPRNNLSRSCAISASLVPAASKLPGNACPVSACAYASRAPIFIKPLDASAFSPIQFITPSPAFNTSPTIGASRTTGYRFATCSAGPINGFVLNAVSSASLPVG